jgi:hypothetical protein
VATGGRGLSIYGAILALVLSSCALPEAESGQPVRTSRQADAVQGVEPPARCPHGLQPVSPTVRWTYWFERDELGKLAAVSDAVLIGTVTGRRRGREERAAGGNWSQVREAQIVVEEVLAGDAPKQVAFQDGRWSRLFHHPERGERLDAFGILDVPVGTRGLFFLQRARGTHHPAWGVVNPQGIYRVSGPYVLDTCRADRLVRRVEGLSLDELRQLIRYQRSAASSGSMP